MLKMGCLNFCLQITSWAVLGGAELDVCPQDERQWIQHLSRKTDRDTGVFLHWAGSKLGTGLNLNFRIFVLGNAQNLTGQVPEVPDLTLELALLWGWSWSRAWSDVSASVIIWFCEILPMLVYFQRREMGPLSAVCFWFNRWINKIK